MSPRLPSRPARPPDTLCRAGAYSRRHREAIVRDIVMFLGLAFVPVTIVLSAICLGARDRASRGDGRVITPH